MSAACLLYLMRPRQWYKNLVVFLPIFFVGALFDVVKIQLVIQAFVALCLMSSCNYIINDIIDIKRDRAHPEKKNRPLAKGLVSVQASVVLAIVLGVCALFLANSLALEVFYLVLGMFVLTSLYSAWFKRVLFADILLIATNFVIRAVAGAYAIAVVASPWLVFCTFLLALFLVVGKRHSDALLLKGKASKHKELLKFYTPDITSALLILSTTAFVMGYSLYSFSRTNMLLITIPFALYVVFRYFYFIYTGNEIARHPEMIVKDTPIIIGIILWVVVTLVVLYVA
ncbi:MAG: UbiA prenyltransferase family protein [Candidatus Nanoarchaeia archaeon]